MIGIAVLVVYAMGWLAAGAMIVRSQKTPGDDGFDKIMLGALAVLTALFWPLVAPIALLWWLSKFESPKQRRDRRAMERDERVRELEWKIRKLERELGIGQGKSA